MCSMRRTHIAYTDYIYTQDENLNTDYIYTHDENP
ncbi:hypothetical protein Pint_07464 [Pistacia integerrima]|nr:hypothetical protein Pint_07464 [Pistacia integerrima]